MKEPFKYRFKRKLKQIFCMKHDWYFWVDGDHKSCNKCDKKVKAQNG